MSQLFRLKNGTVLLSTEAPGGIYNSGQLKKIAELCSKELAIVKATEDQRLALFVKESEVENVAKQLRAMGLGFRHYQDNLHQPVSCLGELCEEHEQPAMATAMDITKEIASIQLTAPLKIGINGCARCCTPCHTLDIAVVGDASGYRISLGGKTRQMPEFASYFAEGVPAKELPKRLKAVIEAYKKLAEEGETLHDVIERCGVTDFVQALAPYSQDAAQREDPFAQEAAADGLPAMTDESLADESLTDESITDDALGDELATMDDLDASADLDVDGDLDVGGELDVSSDLDVGGELDVSGDLDVGDELDVSSDLDATDEVIKDEALVDGLGSTAELESMDDLALNDELENVDDLAAADLEIEDEPAAETASHVLGMDDQALDDKLMVDTDLNIAEDTLDDGALGEIRIEQGGQDSLEDDLALGADDATMDFGEVDLEEPAPQVNKKAAAPAPKAAAAPAPKPKIAAVQDDELLTEESLIEDSMLDDSSLDLMPELNEDELKIDSTAAIAEDDIDLDVENLEAGEETLDELPETPSLDADESISLDDDLSEDLDDSSMTAAETPVDEDLEGIPELDEDLAPEELPVPAPAARSAAPSPAPAPAALQEDFGEELPADVPDLSDEEESQFEEKLHASIDEESRLIAKAEKDPNVGDREAALSLLENSEQMDDELEAIELDDANLEESMADDELEEIASDAELETIGSEDELVARDEVLEPIDESMEEFPEPGPSELAHIKSRQAGQKMQGAAPRQQFKLSAISFQDEHMRVTFESGAYVDFDLSALGLGEERSFRLGVQSVSVTSTSEGYILEVDGMRLFHPKNSFPAAS